MQIRVGPVQWVSDWGTLLWHGSRHLSHG